MPVLRAVTRQAALAALFLTLLVVGSVWSFAKRPPLAEFDQPFYLGIAADIDHIDRFTNGFVFAEPGPDGTRPAGMRFAPLYPWLVSVAAKLDPRFGEEIDCIVATRAETATCGDQATLVRSTQIALLVGFFGLIWWMARLIRPSPLVGWTAIAIALATTPVLIRFAEYVMTEIASLVLFTAGLAALLAARRTRYGATMAAIAGFAFALTALVRPAFLFVCVAIGLVCIAHAAIRPRGANFSLAAAFWLGVGVPLAPWLLRNAMVVGHIGLTHGYDSHTLVQRISFDAMTWREYALSYLCWFPDGQDLGKLLVGPNACGRFGWNEQPDTFYAIGTGSLMQSTVAAAGGWDNHLMYLMRHFILAEPLKHALVTIPLALRGAWVDRYWGVCLFPVCLGLLAKDIRRGAWDFPIVALPALFMLVLNAAIAVNQVRYNLVLIPAFSIAGAIAFDAAVRRWGLARDRGRGTPAADPIGILGSFDFT